MHTPTTAQQHLTHIAEQWPALRALLDTATPTTWPPLMGIANLERDEALQAEAALERAERTAVAPGERPAPLRVAVLDTITALEEALLGLADEIAGSIQRPAFTVRAANPHDAIAFSVAMIGLRDAQDQRRWRFNLAHRDGQVAAAWLADRLQGADGPFRALTHTQRQHINRIAAACRRRLDIALGEHYEDQQPLGRYCECGAELVLIVTKDSFVVRCAGCGTGWSGAELLERLEAA
jgi:hypothetical protein